MRLKEDFERLAEFSGPGPGNTRLAWTPEMRNGLDWFATRMEEAGLSPIIDAAGNLIGRWEVGEGRAVGLGSHLDTVPNGGLYDGALGVLGALAAVELLQERGATPKRPIWIIAFMDEEGVRFGTSMVGSRMFVGDDVQAALAREDADGVSFADAMRGWDRDPERIGEANAVDQLGAFLELHIEQGPSLEHSGTQIGVVSGIVGMIQARVTFNGQTNHAGGTPMDQRRDAMMGVARVALRLRDAAKNLAPATATVGSISLDPGVFNIIPGCAEFTIDFRVASQADFEELEELVEGVVSRIAEMERLEHELVFTDSDPPVELDDKIISAFEQGAELESLSHTRLPSGGGHDAMILSPHVPTGMLFVPCRGGVSHSPDEYASPEQCEHGARVLSRALEIVAC